MRVLRLSLKTVKGNRHVIICICRGKSDRDVHEAIAEGATSVRDLQRCGIGDQCGSCHSSLHSMLASAIAADQAAAAAAVIAAQPQPMHA
jgi:bacterioferritin-associated ferredoxin